MNYYQVSFPVPVEQEKSDILIALLSAVGYESFEEQSKVLIAYIQEDSYDLDDILSIDYINSCFVKQSLKVELIPDKNWNEVWESNYPPVIIENSCYVRAPFHEPIDGMKHEIIIKPKMAFGTAHHETTYLMISFLLENNLSGQNVLDMGCGSGVLAILASMKGAERVTAIDIDQWSYENTKENSEINVIENISVVVGGAEMIPGDMKFDTIMANINKNILLQDMKFYANALNNSGQIYFSGFYIQDFNDICIESEKYGLLFTEKKEKNNWVAAAFRKQN